MYIDRGLHTEYFKRGRHSKFAKLWPPCWKMAATLLLFISPKPFTTRGSCWCKNVHKRVQNFSFKNTLSLKINRSRGIAFQRKKCVFLFHCFAYIFKLYINYHLLRYIQSCRLRFQEQNDTSIYLIEQVVFLIWPTIFSSLLLT